MILFENEVLKTKRGDMGAVYKFGIVVVLAAQFLRGTDSTEDYYTSLVGLQKLAKVEQQIVSALISYVTSLEERLNLARRYLEDYESSVLPAMLTMNQGQGATGKTTTNLVAYNSEKDLDKIAQKVSSHPLMTYRLIRRYTKELVDFERDLRKDYDKQFFRVMEKIRKGMVLPKNNDVNGAIEGLLRLQDAYDVDIKEFAEGSFNGIETNSGLLAVDCYHVGLYSLKSSVYTRAIEWLEQSYELALTGNDTSIHSDAVYDALQEAIKRHNKAITNGEYNPYVYKVKVDPSLGDRGKRVRALAVSEQQYKLYFKDSSMMDFTNFAALCGGKKLRAPKDDTDLKCWTAIKFPMFVLDPIKIEMLHRDPPILQIYEVLSDQLIDHILAMAAPSMARSRVQGSSENQEVASPVRTSATTWMPETEDKIMRNIPSRVEALTGLRVVGFGASEDLQISSYGIGGHYNPHFDTFFDPAFSPGLDTEERLMGDRVATFMFYLSHVEQGGGTAFPRLGVLANPVKGSALFWYNMLRNGEPDPFSLHGGCPVLLGNKWGQMLKPLQGHVPWTVTDEEDENKDEGSASCAAVIPNGHI